MSWEPEVEEIKQRVQMAEQMGGEEGIAVQHSRGKLTIRERIERISDTLSLIHI